jgi:hypothetical protein
MKARQCWRGRPSGPKHAELGLILHCQSKKGDIGEFWDKESRTILLLAEKGFNNSLVFGFDWHWRAEHSARARGGNCPTTKKEQRDLHDKVSEDILKLSLFAFWSLPQHVLRSTIEGHYGLPLGLLESKFSRG